MLSVNDVYKELEKIKPHDHCCLIYESEEEWRDIAIPFITQGLMNGDKCVYVLNEREENYIIECLASEGIDVFELIKSGQLLFLQPRDILRENASDDIDQVVNIYRQWLDSFLAAGYTTMRIAIEALFRLFDYRPYKFLELQLRLNRDVFPYYPIISLCQYHRRDEHPMILRDALISNTWLIKNRQISRNPFCISPEIYFQQKDMAWEAEYWLYTYEKLLESEEKYRLIVENCLDMITIIDLESNKLLYTSPANYVMLGYSPDQVIGRSGLDFIHPGQQEEIMSVLLDVAIKGVGEAVCRVRKEDGSYRWLEAKGTVIRNKGIGDKLIIFSRDIHEKKLAQEALWRSQQNYKNQLSYLNTLINTMNELCITYDRNTMLTFVNQRMVETLGYSLEDMVGKSILDFIPDENKESVRIQISNRLNKGEISSHEHTIIRKDGSTLLVRLKGSPIIENEEIIGGLVLAEDITQQRNLEREMARLAQLNTVGEMAASIGHEIRNPMTTVQGFLQIMSQNEDFKDHHAHFELMLEELGRANSIITEFLALAKDKMVDLQSYNINKILKTLAPLLIADAMNGDKNIRLELGNVPDLLLDEKEIRQLILNLVRNGLEAMHTGGTVTISTCQQGDDVLLSVQDEGEGIAAEILEKLGTPFLSTKDNGTGLGLPVCYSIAARHNAKIIIDTSSNGSIFHVHFQCPKA